MQRSRRSMCGTFRRSQHCWMCMMPTEFLTGIQPSAVTIYEDGQPRPVDKITEAAPPIQLVTAINPGPALAVRDANGTPRFNGVVDSLTAWAGALPEGSQDDLDRKSTRLNSSHGY